MEGGFIREPSTAAEERALAAALKEGEPLVCPRCLGQVVVTPVRPPPGVAYVRNRILVQCRSCGGRAALDRDRKP